jgi:tetratricopeptide (TPR) repeat protein
LQLASTLAQPPTGRRIAQLVGKERLMRSTPLITTVILLTAFGLADCSKDKKKVKPTNDNAAIKPISAPISPPPPLVSDGAAKASSPVPLSSSFEDGKVAYDAKNYKEAASIFEAYLERKPGNAWGYYMLGLSAWKSGDLVKSETAFEKALSIDPKHVKSYVNASRLFIDQKRYDDAIDNLTKAAEVDPESAEVQRLLAKTYRDVGKTDEAIEAYTRAIELNEADAWSMNYLGRLLLDAKRPDEALTMMQQAVELKTNVSEFQNNLGMALEATGDLTGATDAYSKARLLDPRNEEVKQNLARVVAAKAGSGSH